MAVKEKVRRLLFGNTEGDKLDNTPIELPAGHHNIKSAAQEIQEQIAIQIALKQASEGAGQLQTIAEIEQELASLEEDDFDSGDFPEYQYIAMDDFEPDHGEPEPGVGAPPETEGVSQEEGGEKDE